MTGKFTFLVKFDENTIEQTDLEQLLKVTFLLGGLGKRERRGFGSCSIAINDEKCFETIQDVKEFIQDLNLPIESKLEYPYLEKVSIGKKYDSCFAILEDIGLQSHNFNGLYDIHLGFAMRKQHFDKERMASPIYVSVFQDTTGQDTIGFYPIISKLHCAFSKKVEKAIEGYEVKDRSSDFVNALKSTN